MFRTVFWYAAGWTYLFITMPVLLRLRSLERQGRVDKRDELASRFSMMLARALFFLTGSSVYVSGSEKIPEGPVLFVSNHQSHIDSAVIHGFILRPKGFIADKDAGNIPVLRAWMKYMKCVFIDRNNTRSNISSMEEGIRILKEGHSLVIYPEGRINTSGQLIDFRRGCLKLAVKAGVPIVPVTLVDTWRVMDRMGLGIGSAHVKCIISDPVYLSGKRNKDDKILKKVKDLIANNLR